MAQRLILDEKLMRAVIGMEIVGEVPQIVYERMGRAFESAIFDGLREAGEPLDELDLLRLREPRER